MNKKSQKKVSQGKVSAANSMAVTLKGTTNLGLFFTLKKPSNSN
jgi:hypothetical protein